MHVFVTGATGLVGKATVKQLISQKHTVSALARSDKSEQLLKELGVASVIRGSTTSIDILKQAASQADAVIHAAFDHDSFGVPGGLLAACEQDRTAIQALGDGLLATSDPKQPKTLIYTSGLLGNDGPDENSGKIPNEHLPRHLSDDLVHSYSAKGLRTIIVRLAPIVHGPGYEHPFIAGQAGPARKHGYAAYVGDGQQKWGSVHVDDAANLICLGLTKAPSGSNFHCLAEEVTVKEVVERVGRKLNLPTKSIEAKDAFAHFESSIALFLQADIHATSELTVKWTGWQPTGYNLFKEMEGYEYPVHQA